MKKPPVVLTIAGSDNSCGAGLQADLKTITALGGYAQTAVTCVVAEVPSEVSAIQAVKPAIVAEQVKLSLRAFPVKAIKTGMLYSTAIIRSVAEVLAGLPGRVPLVIDPVMVASSGDPLLKKSAIVAYETLLFPLATLVTPNLDELRILSGMPCRNLAEMKEAGEAMVAKFGCAFLLKGGHLQTTHAVDVLVSQSTMREFAAKFRPNVDAHGTGCTFSAAIATGLACGLSLEDSVAQAKRFVTFAIGGMHCWGKTTALNHSSAAR